MSNNKLRRQIIPDYVDCKNKEIEPCDYYIHKDCPETCAYAKDIKGLFVGSLTEEDIGRLENEIMKGGIKNE